MAERKAVNSMCLNCAKYGNECDGTVSTVWTGCVYKVKKEETTEEKAARMFELYSRRLVDLSEKHGQTRYNVIEYLCHFPKISPVTMAAELMRNGYKVVFDDSSISAKENGKKRATVVAAM